MHLDKVMSIRVQKKDFALLKKSARKQNVPITILIRNIIKNAVLK